MSATFKAMLKYSLCIGLGILVEFPIVFAVLMVKWSEHSPLPPLPTGFAFVIPYYSLASARGEENAVAVVFACATVIQMPLYGWILGRGWVRHRFGRYALVLAGVHLTTAIAGFLVHTKPQFLPVFAGLLLAGLALGSRRGIFRSADRKKAEDGYDMLERAGRLERIGQVGEALELYQKTVTQYPNTTAGRDAEASLRSLRAQI
jgi:hypothetical protein